MKREKVRSERSFLLALVLPKVSIFLPHDRKFFELFEALADKTVEAAELLVELCSAGDYSRICVISERLGILEDEADTIVHEIVHELFFDHTRVTEEKGDIRYFAHNLDNVIDGIEKAVRRLTFTHTLPESVSEFAPVILEASREISMAVHCLRDMRCEEGSLEAHCIRINELENEADEINRRWLRRLMTTPTKTPDEVLERLLLKEIVEILEDTMDQCEDVANILETFRLKGGF